MFNGVGNRDNSDEVNVTENIFVFCVWNNDKYQNNSIVLRS